MSASMQPEIFQGKGSFMELAHFNTKNASSKTQEKSPVRNYFGVFSPRFAFWLGFTLCKNKAYRKSVWKEHTVKKCLLILELKPFRS